jgi:hypothetical protein
MRDEDQDPIERRANSLLLRAAFFFVAFLWCWLLWEYPDIWAFVNGIALMTVFGLLTSVFVFKIKSPLIVAAATCFFGTLWMTFFWLVIQLPGWLRGQ